MTSSQDDDATALNVMLPIGPMSGWHKRSRHRIQTGKMLVPSLLLRAQYSYLTLLTPVNTLPLTLTQAQLRGTGLDREQVLDCTARYCTARHCTVQYRMVRGQDSVT